MKAATYSTYGAPEVVSITEVPTPTPSPNEVLIKVHATTVTTGDWRVRSLNLPRGFGFMGRLIFGISKPRQPILGIELAGVIEAVGASVTRFKVGEAVIAFPDVAMGAHAEYRCMTEDGKLVRKPENLTFEEAASLMFGGTTALDIFRRGKLKAGDTVLINGASGGVGASAVQLAKHAGAHVTAVCSAANLDFVRSLGADQVIDYGREDFMTQNKKYDVVVDIAGTAPFAKAKPVLNDGGRLLVVLGTLAGLFSVLWAALTSNKKVISGPVTVTPDDLQTLANLAQSGVLKPVIAKRFAFVDIVEAHRLVDSGHKRGSVVVTVVPETTK